MYVTNYTSEEIETIIGQLVDFVSEIVDSRYNTGYFDTKKELIDWWVNHGFHREEIEEWYCWLDED